MIINEGYPFAKPPSRNRKMTVDANQTFLLCIFNPVFREWKAVQSLDGDNKLDAHRGFDPEQNHSSWTVQLVP